MDESETTQKAPGGNGRALTFKPRGMLRMDDAQYERLRRVAYEEHIPMTQIIRDGVERRLNDIERNRERRRGKPVGAEQA